MVKIVFSQGGGSTNVFGCSAETVSREEKRVSGTKR